MTSLTHTLLRFAAKLTRCLSLALLPALASEARALNAPQRKPIIGTTTDAPAAGRPDTNSSSTPYLTALGSLPLRFARPNLERSDEPPALPPPPPAAENSPSPEKTAEPVKTPEPVSQPPEQPKPPAQPSSETPKAPAPEPEPATAPPLPILPDDMKRELRPEEVLLYFRYPNAGPTGTDSSAHIVVPITPAQTPSAPPPRSSATYEQK
jgi:outer membrane biosynthesis protein TonB